MSLLVGRIDPPSSRHKTMSHYYERAGYLVVPEYGLVAGDRSVLAGRLSQSTLLLRR